MRKLFCFIILALFTTMICCCLAEEIEMVPGTDRKSATVITPGTIIYSEAANQPLWYTFEADKTGEWTLAVTDVSLRWYPSNNSGEYLPVPVMITDRFERVFADTEIQIPNDTNFHPTYSQDNQKSTLVFNVTEGSTYYILLNVSAYDLSANPGPVSGFFSISLCSNDSHVPSPDMVIMQEGTCETPEIAAQVCALCGTILSTEEHPAPGHNFGEEQVLEPASCQHEGSIGRICSTCGAQEQTGKLSVLAHQPGVTTVYSAPTCTTDGYAEQRCEVCNEIIKSETTPAFGHTPGEVKIISSPTCETEGSAEQHCQTCNALIDRQVLPALGHQPGDMVVVVELTCTANGLNEQRCTRCNALINSEIIPASGHHKGQFHTVREPDAEMPGEEVAVCLTCGQVLESRNIPALGGYNVAYSSAPRYMSLEEIDLSLLNLSDMIEMQEHTNDIICTSVADNAVLIQEASESKLFDACYVPFCVELNVPAFSSVDAEYVFDISSIKQASGGSAVQTVKLIDLGDDPSIEGICVDASNLQDQAFISFTIGTAGQIVEDSNSVKVSYTNFQDQPVVVKHYFGLFSSINWASTYAHIMNTKCLITMQAEWTKVSQE